MRKSAHAVYKTEYHLVWVTKYRKEILNKGVSEYIKLKLKEVLKYCPGLVYLEIGMDKDHIHIHLVIPPKYSVATVGINDAVINRYVRMQGEEDAGQAQLELG